MLLAAIVLLIFAVVMAVLARAHAHDVTPTDHALAAMEQQPERRAAA